MKEWGIEVGVVQLVVWLGIAVSMWFCTMSVIGAWRLLGRRREEDRTDASWTPGVTILKPLNGLEAGLYANLVSFCTQDYPAFQIVFGVADADDPAVGWVRRLKREYPEADIELVVDGRIHGTNYKISNVVNMYGHAKHDIVVLADSDIRVPTDYLRRVVAPLRDERTGMVTCLYRGVNAGGLASLVDVLCVNTDFCHQVMVARQIEKASYAFGATMVFRRADLEAIGGFRAVVDMLADDFFLGNLIAARGPSIRLSDCVVETVVDVGSWKSLLRHQVRWARTNRSARPVSYFFTVLTHGTAWALANLLLNGPWGSALAVSGAMLGTRLVSAAYISWRYLGTNLGAAELLAMLAKDLFVSAVWLASFLGNTVWWGGRQFRVARGGAMHLIAAGLPESTRGVVANQPS